MILALAGAISVVPRVGYNASYGQEHRPGLSRQQRSAERRERPQYRDEGQRGTRRQRQHSGHGPPGGPQRRHMLGLLPFPPSEADYGPLRPGEEEELVDFARQNVPKLARLLKRFRERNPREFRRKLEEIAPWLRHLRRIFDHDPELGRLIVRHTEITQRIYRGRAMIRKLPKDDERRQHIKGAIRRDVAESMRIECQILDRRAAALEARRDEIVAERMAQLTAPECDLSPEPPEIRTAIEALHAAENDEDRQTCAAELARLVGERLDARITGMRARAERMREAGPEEVDRRVERLLAPGPGRRPKPAQREGGGC